MADEEKNVEKDNENKGKKHDSGTADLEKVTDFEEEKEISPQSIQDAMKIVAEKQRKVNEEKLLREKELARVKVNKEDVELIMNEMEITRPLAERKLKEHRSDLVLALRDLLN